MGYPLSIHLLSLNQFEDYPRFIVPSPSQFICRWVKKIKESLNLFLITFSNTNTELLSCETYLGDAACESLGVGGAIHTKNEDDNGR